MMRTTPPDWVREYIDLRFKDKGRDRDGVDCWGLVRLVYAERFGVLLPSLDDQYLGADDGESIAPIFERETVSNWTRREAGPEAVGDVCIFRTKGIPWHVGIAVDRERFLHILRGVDSVCERFDSPVWKNRVVGWFAYTGPVEVARRRTVLDPHVVRSHAPEGLTVEAIANAAGLDSSSPGLEAYIGDRIVPRGTWNRVRPKAGRRVVFATRFEGGGDGKAVTRVLATIAIIVAAAYAGPAIAGALGYTTTGSAAALATAGVSLAGTLAVNALIPPPVPSLSDIGVGSSPTLQGAGNTPRPFQPVPVVFGRHVIAPPYGARPYSEVVGSDQFLRLLFVPGYGPLAISDIKIGETPIEEYEDYEIEVRSGVEDEDPITIYPNTVSEEGLSVLLSGVGDWTTRTSGDEATELSVDITFPRGLGKIEADGTYTERSVGFIVEYATSGTGQWNPINVSSPGWTRPFDVLFRTPDVELISTGFSSGRLFFGTLGGYDALPAWMSTTNDVSAEMTGYFYAPVSGLYRFALDSSDASDLQIRGRTVVSHLGVHVGQGVPVANGEIRLSRGYHQFRARVESRQTIPTMAVYWQKPGDSDYAAVPETSIFRFARRTSPNGYRYRFFNTLNYSSDILVTAGQAEQLRKTISWAVQPGRYDVRVRRVTENSTDTRVFDLAYWTALRTITNQSPIRLPGLSTIALRIRATDQVNGVLDSLNCVAESIVPDYDAESGEWIERATSNPASIYRAILQSPANKRPAPDEKIDLATLERWHTRNEELGLSFDAVFDFEGTVFERLQMVASAGRAAFAYNDGKYSVVIDEPRNVPVQHFTPRNSKNIRGKKTFADLPHGLRCTFLNREADYGQDERIVLDDGYVYPDKAGILRDAFGVERTGLPVASRFEVLDLFGVVEPDAVWRHGRYYLAVAKLRPETIDIDVDIEHLVCTRGDLVLLTHDVPLVGLHSGRVVARITNGSGLVSGVVVDEEIVMDETSSFGFRSRLSDGTSFYREVARQPGTQTSIYFDSPVPADQPSPNVGDLFSFGYRGQETREYVVKSIRMGTDLSATLTLLDYAPAVHTADSGEIPDFDPGISTPPVWNDGPQTPVIEQIRSDDFVAIRGVDGTFIPRMLIYLRQPSGTREWPTHAQIRYRLVPSSGSVSDVPWTYIPDQPIRSFTVAIDNVVAGATYEIELRVVDSIGRVSVWVAATHTVVGHVLPPPNVQSFDVVRMSDGTRLFSWDLGDIPPDVVGVRIRYGRSTNDPAWEDTTDLQDGAIEGASPFESNSPPAGTWKIGIKAVDSQGLESADALFIVRTLGQPRLENVAVSVDAKIDNWPGTKTDCYRSQDGSLYAIGRVPWSGLPSTWSNWLSWTLDPASPITYEHGMIDAGFVFDFEPAASIETDGEFVVYFDYSEDGVVWQGWTDISVYASRTVRARYAKFRVEVTRDPSNPIPAIHEAVFMLRAETITEDVQDVFPPSLSAEYRIADGDFRVPISSSIFSAIRSVQLSFNGTGAGWTWELVDRDRVPGPRVRTYNPDGVLANATVDAVVRGLRAVERGVEDPASLALQFDEPTNAVAIAVI